MQNEYTTGSLFSGVGGIELGFEREGFRTEWFIEKEPFCQKVLKQNFPGRPVYGDITKIKWDEMPRVDVLTGGFPCQDISIAGRGEGITGERSGLWKHYAKAIRILRPKFAIIENVPALKRRGLDVVLADIAKEGYDAEWFDLRARDFGALHKRERIFIIAYSNEIRCRRGLYATKSESQDATEDERRIISPIIITNDWQERIQRFRQETLQGEQGFSWCKDVRRIKDLQGRPNIPEPLFRGGRDGIPNWMDRVKACGNAVVPQMAQFIARRIKEVI